LHFVTDHATFFLGVNAVGALDRLDVAALVANTGAYEFVRGIDFFCQLEGPVVRRTFVGIVDADF
jgi:hypothetical protein